MNKSSKLKYKREKAITVKEFFKQPVYSDISLILYEI
jgi:hypothetical protein